MVTTASGNDRQGGRRERRLKGAPSVSKRSAGEADSALTADVIDEVVLMAPNIVTQFGQPPYRIDLLNAIDGLSFKDVWSGAISTTVEGNSIRVIGLAELPRNKSVTGRKKDIDDVRKLTAQRVAKRSRLD